MIEKKILYSRATLLRRNMTQAERCLWDALRNRRLAKLKFRRQVVFGNYSVDFFCREKQLVIELDGGLHIKRQKKDFKITRFLSSQGFTVIRFWNSDVLLDAKAILEHIRRRCMKWALIPTFSRSGEGAKVAGVISLLVVIYKPIYFQLATVPNWLVK